jgi:hypothetical protein
VSPTKELAALLRELPEHITSVTFIIGDRITMANFTNLGTIGNLNYQGVQVADSINTTVGELTKHKDTEDIGNAIRELTKAIGEEATLSEKTRKDFLDQIEFLGAQAKTPADQRKEGFIERTINTLSGMCAGAGGLAAVWATWGPAISKFFGV